MNNLGVTFPKGYKSAGVACGLKKNNDPDLALIVSDKMAVCSGVFTLNVVKGHSLQLCSEYVKSGKAKAVLINAGNANACVGRQGYLDALAICELTASALDCSPNEILFGSTGVIGQPLPMEKLFRGIKKAYDNLGYTNGLDSARAIMTTDTHPKTAEAEIILDGRPVRIGAMAKGSGMIHPNMATMISVITTDIKMSKTYADDVLKRIADLTYNRVIIDGDTSVCDKVILLANGQSGVDIDGHEDAFYGAMLDVCTKLSKMLAKDGEGATKLIRVEVLGAKTQNDAKLIAQSIAKSPLCKTAAFGQDANWGRLLTAAGYSGADFDSELCDVYIGDLLTCKSGTALPFDEDKALEILKEENILYRIDLNQGKGCFHVWTCDFSYDYIKINASYRT